MQRDNLRAKMMALDDNYWAKIASKILDDNWDVPPESRPSSSKIAKTKDGAPGGERGRFRGRNEHRQTDGLHHGKGEEWK